MPAHGWWGLHLPLLLPQLTPAGWARLPSRACSPDHPRPTPAPISQSELSHRLPAPPRFRNPPRAEAESSRLWASRSHHASTTEEEATVPPPPCSRRRPFETQQTGPRRRPPSLQRLHLIALPRPPAVVFPQGVKHGTSPLRTHSTTGQGGSPHREAEPCLGRALPTRSHNVTSCFPGCPGAGGLQNQSQACKTEGNCCFAQLNLTLKALRETLWVKGLCAKWVCIVFYILLFNLASRSLKGGGIPKLANRKAAERELS